VGRCAPDTCCCWGVKGRRKGLPGWPIGHGPRWRCQTRAAGPTAWHPPVVGTRQRSASATGADLNNRRPRQSLPSPADLGLGLAERTPENEPSPSMDYYIMTKNQAFSASARGRIMVY
jgi:hypothetical protein